MWFYLEKRRKCLFIDHQLTHESYNGLNVNNLPIYICVAFLTWGNHYTDDQILPIIEMIACMGAWCYRITYDAVHLKLLHIFKKYVLENVKEYIWFWTDKIKHTCYIEIIQDQYAIIIDNFIYCFNRLLCALGKGGGLSQILHYISWNWWDKIFFKNYPQVQDIDF